MADRLDATPDHVAVAVPDFDVAHRRWNDELGGRTCSWFHAKGYFRSRQYRFSGGAKLELIQPSETAPDPDANFVRRFLGKHGSRVHHLTLKVADVREAASIVEAQGFDVIDIDTSNDYWHEGFLRPSQVGGLIVQIAWARHSDEEWAARHDVDIEPPPADGARLLGPLLRHPDLD